MPDIFAIRGNNEHPEFPFVTMAAKDISSALDTYTRVYSIGEKDLTNIIIMNCNTSTAYQIDNE